MAEKTTNQSSPASAGDLDKSGPANIAPATEFHPSGVPNQVTDFDINHPAVDANPRAGTTVNQNRIDFNDPTKSGHEAVAEKLGMKVVSDAEVLAAAVEPDKANAKA